MRPHLTFRYRNAVQRVLGCSGVYLTEAEKARVERFRLHKVEEAHAADIIRRERERAYRVSARTQTGAAIGRPA